MLESLVTDGTRRNKVIQAQGYDRTLTLVKSMIKVEMSSLFAIGHKRIDIRHIAIVTCVNLHIVYEELSYHICSFCLILMEIVIEELLQPTHYGIRYFVNLRIFVIQVNKIYIWFQ